MLSVRFAIERIAFCDNSNFQKSTPGTHATKAPGQIAFVIAANRCVDRAPL